MKYAFAFYCALFLNLSASHALELRDIVLGEDVSESPTIHSFPCSQYIDVVSCGAGFLALEKNCKETLKIDKQALSCRSLSGDTVVFAQVLTNTRFADETFGGSYGYKLNFSPRVSLVSFTTPNGNTEYQIVVK